jgi:hypothetical protein
MDNRNIRNQAPWPEDFDGAMNAHQKALGIFECPESVNRSF